MLGFPYSPKLVDRILVTLRDMVLARDHVHLPFVVQHAQASVHGTGNRRLWWAVNVGN